MPASHIEGAADGGNVTLYTAGVVLSSTTHRLAYTGYKGYTYRGGR